MKRTWTAEPATYFEEAAHLEREFWKAVGEALELGIKVVHFGVPGVPWKSLGELQDEITIVRLSAELARREWVLYGPTLGRV